MRENRLVEEILSPNFRQKLTRLIARKVADPMDVDEIVQDTLLSALDSLPGFKGQSQLFTWVGGIARHEIVDFYRRKKIKQIVFSKLPFLEKLVSQALGPELAYQELETKTKILATLKRLSEGYGFHAEAVEELKNLGTDLIITVDVGITSFKAFEKALELGVDVILTDHHLPADELPKALTIINPNQKDCSSDLGYLCGAGVAFYLLRAVKRAFYDDSELPKNEWDLKEVLEFFCIGTLTDMVPLVKDNRVLVKYGLKSL